MTSSPPYPLKFNPIYKEKVWGGREMEKLGRSLPAGEAVTIGESWELADLGQTAISGGGGGAERSIIANGPLKGAPLHDIPDAWLGRLKRTADGDFPLLVKFLNSRENLSVQVHPSEAYAAEHDDAHLKSEAWYIVDAEPGSVIYKGVREGVTPEAFRAAIESGDAQKVTDLMIVTPVKPGDCHYLPSGTCHALGAGLLVAEVQTPSDTTFRVFDWGRTDRELHVEQAMQCITFGPPEVGAYEKRTHTAGMFTTVSRLVSCEHFAIEKVRMSEAYEQEIPYDQPAVWMVLEGGGEITLGEGLNTTFTRGETLLLPAGMHDPRVRLDADTVWLEITFPQTQRELFA